MKYNWIIGLLLGGICTSCQFFDTQRISSETFYEEEYQNLDWNDVDTYPAFPSCESYTEKTGQQQCFQQIIVQNFEQVLKQHQVMTTVDMNDTLHLLLEVDQEGTLLLTEVEADTLTWQQIPSLRELAQETITTLPKPAPAYKRGIPVKVQLTLPVLLNSADYNQNL